MFSVSIAQMFALILMLIYRFPLSSVESQKGINAVQRCSIENQKGNIAVQPQWW